MTEYYKILRIEDTLSNLSLGQIGVEAGADSILGVPAWGGKDYSGNVSKWAVLGLDAQFSDLQLIGSSTTGELGILKHDASGNVTGGQMTLTEFNDYISDETVGPAYWDRDVSGYLFPVTDTDTIIVGDGTVTDPGIAFKNGTNYGLRYENSDSSIRIVGEGEDFLDFRRSSSVAYIEAIDKRFLRITNYLSTGVSSPEIYLVSDGSGDALGAKVTIAAQTTDTSVVPSYLTLKADGGYAYAYVDAYANDASGNADSRFGSTSYNSSASALLYTRSDSTNSDSIVSIIAEHRGSQNSEIYIGTDTHLGSGAGAIYIGTTGPYFTEAVYMTDANKSGSSWTETGIPLSTNAAQWTSIRDLIGGYGSLLAAIISASLTGPAPALTAGYVGYGSATNELTGEASFFYDAANNYLGIGHATPDCGLHVGANNPTYSSGGSDAFITGDLEVTNIDLINTIRGHGFTAGSIPYFSGSPPALTESNSTFRFMDTGFRIQTSNASGGATSYLDSTSVGADCAMNIKTYAPEDYDSTIVLSALTSGTGSSEIYIAADCTGGSPLIRMEAGAGSPTTLLNLDDDIGFRDINHSGSTWASPTIDLSASTAEWSSMETLIGSEGSLFGGILAAAESLVAEGAGETANSTSSNSYQQRIRVTTPSLTSGVGYLILWSCEIQGQADVEVQAQVQLNDTTTIAEAYYNNEPYATRGTCQSGIYYSDSLSGVQNIDLDWRKAYPIGGGDLAYCGRARITVLRVNL